MTTNEDDAVFNYGLNEDGEMVERVYSIFDPDIPTWALDAALRNLNAAARLRQQYPDN